MLQKIKEWIQKDIQMKNEKELGESFIRLSPSTGLNLHEDCPACFWRKTREGKPRPRGIVASLNNGLDLLIKDYFDLYRGKLPPELVGKVKGTLVPNLQMINQWRHWSSGVKYENNVLNAQLFGALDDCLICAGKYYPVDYKCRGFPPKEGQSVKFYQTQLDSYALCLESSGYPAGKYGYLVYYYPLEVKKNGSIKFAVEVVRLTVNVLRAKQKFEAAVRTYRGSKPQDNEQCEYCRYLLGLTK